MRRQLVFLAYLGAVAGWNLGSGWSMGTEESAAPGDAKARKAEPNQPVGIFFGPAVGADQATSQEPMVPAVPALPHLPKEQPVELNLISTQEHTQDIDLSSVPLPPRLPAFPLLPEHPFFSAVSLIAGDAEEDEPKFLVPAKPFPKTTKQEKVQAASNSSGNGTAGPPVPPARQPGGNESSSIVCTFMIPEEALPGMHLKVTCAGHDLSLEVPSGANPDTDMLRVEVWPKDSEQEEDSEKKVTVVGKDGVQRRVQRQACVSDYCPALENMTVWYTPLGAGPVPASIVAINWEGETPEFVVRLHERDADTVYAPMTVKVITTYGNRLSINKVLKRRKPIELPWLHPDLPRPQNLTKRPAAPKPDLQPPPKTEPCKEVPRPGPKAKISADVKATKQELDAMNEDPIDTDLKVMGSHPDMKGQ